MALSILFDLSEMIFLVSLVDFLPPVDSLECVLSRVHQSDVSVVDITVGSSEGCLQDKVRRR